MQSLDEIYREYADMVYRFLLPKTGNEFIAEEVTQETFYQAVRCSEKYDGTSKVSTWI
ncbi:MAG: sigma factor [Eubacteriales bacterium]|nr:sigma factor [Eubacteriales bacterium]